MADVRGQPGVSSRDQTQWPGQEPSLSGFPRHGGLHQVPRGALHHPNFPML